MKSVKKVDVLDIEKIRQICMRQFRPLLGKIQGPILGNPIILLLGNRIKDISCGGAPSSPNVLEFLRECYGPIVDEGNHGNQIENLIKKGYACTEAGMISDANGVLYNNVQFKLRDVPDYSYFVTDKPYPRGELLIKTPWTISGYFDREDTARAFDEEGW